MTNEASPPDMAAVLRRLVAERDETDHLLQCARERAATLNVALQERDDTIRLLGEELEALRAAAEADPVDPWGVDETANPEDSGTGDDPDGEPSSHGHQGA